MPRYILQFKRGKRTFRTKPVEADNHRQALEKIRNEYYFALLRYSDFKLLDKIGVVKDDNNVNDDKNT